MSSADPPPVPPPAVDPLRDGAWLSVAVLCGVLLVLDAVGALVLLLVRRDVSGTLRAVAFGVGLYWFVIGALRRTSWFADAADAGLAGPTLSARRAAVYTVAALGCGAAVVAAVAVQMLLAA